MARGSGAGTGVIVALVVSVVCNVGLLTITFMMYSGKAEALEAKATAQAEMTQFIKPSDRTNEFERQMDAARSNQKSLHAYLQGERKEVAAFVTGNPNADLTEMRSSLGLGDGDVVRSEMTDLRRQQDDANPFLRLCRAEGSGCLLHQPCRSDHWFLGKFLTCLLPSR